MKLTTIIVLLIVAVLIISGCSPKPYSPKQVTSYLEAHYHAKGRFTLQEVMNEYEYIYYDKDHEAAFTVRTTASGWGGNAFVPFPNRSIYPHLNGGIMYAYREQAMALAKEHGLSLLPVDALDETANDIILLSDFSQIDSAAALFFELFDLYRLERVDSFDGGATFCYNASGKAWQDAIRIENISYCQLTEGKGYLYFENESQLSAKLNELWRRNSLLPQPHPDRGYDKYIKELEEFGIE